MKHPTNEDPSAEPDRPAKPSAGPHVWVAARTAINLDAKGVVESISHAWTLEEMFSKFAVEGLTPASPGKFTRAELPPLAEVNVTSLEEFGFFTEAHDAKGARVSFAKPKDHYLEHANGLLTLHSRYMRNPAAARSRLCGWWIPPSSWSSARPPRAGCH